MLQLYTYLNIHNDCIIRGKHNHKFLTLLNDRVAFSFHLDKAVVNVVFITSCQSYKKNILVCFIKVYILKYSSRLQTVSELL